MIGLLRELRDPRDRPRSNRADFDYHPERSIVVVERNAAALQLRSLSFRQVVGSALAVFLGKCQAFEDRRAAQGGGKMSGTGGQIDYVNLGQQHPHFFAFERVVVEKRERVDADVQIGRELADIFRLCFSN